MYMYIMLYSFLLLTYIYDLCTSIIIYIQIKMWIQDTSISDCTRYLFEKIKQTGTFLLLNLYSRLLTSTL